MLWFPFLLACSSPERIKIDVAGHARNYFLHVPDRVAKPAPLVLVFHGGGPGGRYKGRMAAKLGFDEAADAERFVVAYPSSWRGNWDDGRDYEDAPPPEIDDLAFVDAVLADIADRVQVDTTRVFSTGISNGGFFTQRLACERTTVFTGFAPVIASMPKDHGCSPSAAAPMWMIAGTEDTLVPWDGGQVAEDRGEVIAVEDAAEFWAVHNNCDPGATVDKLADVDPDDGTRVHRHLWTGCDAHVQLDEIRGMGHTWPSLEGGQYLPKSWIGPASHEYEAATEIVDWLLLLPPRTATEADPAG